MKLLVLIPRSSEVRLVLHETEEGPRTARIAAACSEGGGAAARTSIRSFIRLHGHPDAVALYTPWAGLELPLAAPVGDEVLRKLHAAAGRAPLHVPALLSAIEAVAAECPGAPTAVVCGSPFFAAMPAAERAYAVGADLRERLGLERTGHHGLFHLAAGDLASATPGAARVLSICMEPCPEAVALDAGRPAMVTGGATPLEGLPGQTTCGEIDPGMILILAQEQKMGPEEIGQHLTRESGLKGLVGRRTDFSELFASRGPELRAAREIFLYRLLQAAGSAMALMGGLDAFVFSGRHFGAGRVIGPCLAEQLRRLPSAPAPRTLFVEDALDDLVAAKAVAALRESSAAAC